MKYIVLLFIVVACSKKSILTGNEIPPVTNGAEAQTENKLELLDSQVKLMSELNAFENKKISSVDFGNHVADIFQETKDTNLDQLNPAQRKEFYKSFFKKFNSAFNDENDQSLIFLATMLRINNGDKFKKLVKEEKEKAILDRIGGLPAETFLETQFFLANYFKEVRLFNLLKKRTNEDKYQLCNGHLMDFVKKVYEKNSKYPDAFEKYAIWGEILDDCDLAPIYLYNFQNVKLEMNSSQLQFKIFANVLMSPLLDNFNFNLSQASDRPLPLLTSIIHFNKFTLEMILKDKRQKEFNQNQLNENFALLEKVLEKYSDQSSPEALNMADQLWYELIFKNKYLNHLTLPLSEKNYKREGQKQNHIFLELFRTRPLTQNLKSEIDTFIKDERTSVNLDFKTKWRLLKQNLAARSYVEILSKDATGNSDAIRKLRDIINKNIIASEVFKEQETETTSNFNLYNKLGGDGAGFKFTSAGDVIIYEGANKEDQELIVHPLSKLEFYNDNSEILDVSKIRYGILDLGNGVEMSAENFCGSLQCSEFNKVIYKYDFFKSRDDEYLPPNSPRNGNIDCTRDPGKDHDGNRNVRCYLKSYQVTTNLEIRNTKLEKSSNGDSSKDLFITNDNAYSQVLIFNMGKSGHKGYKGVNAPFCVSGAYYPFKDYKYGKVEITYSQNDRSEYIIASVSKSNYDIDATASGDGGDGGDAGNIAINGHVEGIVGIALGGEGGAPGDVADCAVGHDKFRPLIGAAPKHLVGNKGENGKEGLVEKISEESNE